MVVNDDVGSGHLHRKFSEVEGWHRTALCLAAVIIWTCNPPYKAFLFSFPPVFRIFLQFLLSLALVTHRQPLDPRSLSQNQVHRFRRF